MPRIAAPGFAGALALALTCWAGCLGPKSHDCASDGMSWVCPAELACADAPTYCANPEEVGACDGKQDHDPCRTAQVADGQCIDNACQACSNDLEGCRYIGWIPMTVPGGTFKVAYAAAPGDAWVGGSVLLHYDGARWTPDATFPSAAGDVTGISGTSSDHLFVATDTNSAVYHLVAGAWVNTPTVQPTKAIWAAGADEAFAVGLAGDVEHFDGTAWTQLSGTMTAQTLAAVWGTSPTDVYAVGNAGTVIHYNGTTWTAATAGAMALSAVWGPGPGDVYVGGAGGVYHTADGTTYAPEYTADGVLALWGSSSGDVFAGTKANGVLHSDETPTWAPMVTPAQNITGIAGSGPSEAFAVTSDAILRYTGAAWTTPLPASTTVDLTGVWVTSASSVLAVGTSGTIESFDGSGWSSHAVSASINLNGVWARSATDAVAVGTSIEELGGTTWTTTAAPDNVDLNAVTGTAAAEYAVGTELVTSSGGAWSSITTFTSSENGLWVAPDGAIFVAGDGLYVYRSGALATLLDETGWTAIWGTSSSDVFAVGNGGKIRHFDGSSWSVPMDSGTVEDLHAVWGASDDDVFAAGDAGTLLHFHTQLWATVPPPAGVAASFASVAGAGSTIFVVGAGGAAERLIESAP